MSRLLALVLLASSEALTLLMEGTSPDFSIPSPTSNETASVDDRKTEGTESEASAAIAVVEPHTPVSDSLWSLFALEGTPGYSLMASSTSHNRVTTKEKLVLLIIEMMGLGALGIDRMYLGSSLSVCTGILKLLTCGGCGVWAIIDLVAVLVNCLLQKTSIDFLFMEADFGSAQLEVTYWTAIVYLLAVGVILQLCCLVRFCRGFSHGFYSIWKYRSQQSADREHLGHHISAEPLHRAGYTRRAPVDACVVPPNTYSQHASATRPWPHAPPAHQFRSS